jgi:hypothetical protein
LYNTFVQETSLRSAGVVVFVDLIYFCLSDVPLDTNNETVCVVQAVNASCCAVASFASLSVLNVLLHVIVFVANVTQYNSTFQYVFEAPVKLP